MKQKNVQIDAILDGFDFSYADDSEAENRLPVTIWIHADKKHEFDSIQAASRKKFGKHLKKIIELAIDRAKIKAS